MKRNIVIGIIFLISGLVVGNNIYNKIDRKLLQTFNEDNTYYLLQEGVYNSKESMQSQTRNVNPKISQIKDNKYHVYVGITKSKDNAQKIKDIYEKSGYEIYIKEIKIDDDEFFNNVTQFDILIDNTDNEDEILTIEEVVLSSYEKKLENS